MTAESQGPKLGTAFAIFLVGAIAGVAGTVIVPNLIRPYLPDSMVGSGETVHGVVTGKRMETDRLLLTMPTPGGTVLATFTDDLAEIDLMIQVGDSLTFGMERYQPFVTNPTIARVVTQSSPLNRPAVPQADTLMTDSSHTAEHPDPGGPDSTGVTTDAR